MALNPSFTVRVEKPETMLAKRNERDAGMARHSSGQAR